MGRPVVTAQAHGPDRQPRPDEEDAAFAGSALDDALFLPCDTCRRPVRMREARRAMSLVASVLCSRYLFF